MSDLPPCILFEDEHLLVANKPPGLNTHAPSPYAGEGLYDWLRHREPRWENLAIVHRLDKETSGVMVFPKTTLASRSLTEQFTQRSVAKRYLFLTKSWVRQADFLSVSALVRVGAKYLARPVHAGGERAETRFRVLGTQGDATLVQAEPLTGKTHQIRAQAAAEGFPILGDVLYGGPPLRRVCLHAAEIAFQHPNSGAEQIFSCPAEFDVDPAWSLRAALIDPALTNAYRLLHGAADGQPGLFVDRLGPFLLAQSEAPMCSDQERVLRGILEKLNHATSCKSDDPALIGIYHKLLRRQPAQVNLSGASPQLFEGGEARAAFQVFENGLRYELSFGEGYSVGLFLDQRDNRHRLLQNHVGRAFPVCGRDPKLCEVLNVFAYSCAFSLCAAKAGAKTTSLDLSRKYLEWGQRNFTLNQMDLAGHDFIYGDAFEWMRRLHKKGRVFDVILLDPPTFSRSKSQGVFRAQDDYQKLVATALPLLKPAGLLFTSVNSAEVLPDAFLSSISAAVNQHRRRIVQQQYFPQPPDFPVTRSQPAYLKTAWSRIE